MPSFQSVLDASLGTPATAEALLLLRGLHNAHPKSQHVPVIIKEEDAFPLSKYLRANGGGEPTVVEWSREHDDVATRESFVQFEYSKKQKEVNPVLMHGKVTFEYRGVAYAAFKARWTRQYSSYTLYDLVFDADTDAPGRALAAAVFTFGATLRDEIWVYQGAAWKADKDLYRAVQAASWDDVVLTEPFKDGLRRDAQSFFECKDVYDELGVTWKRGILLLGPPGNGKTESIKALLKESTYPALYVKSFTTPYGPEYGVRSIFAHARKHAPCILVLEDLDAMVTDKVRSFFLNELDGLADNAGILTIATTNHPERIDEAILSRPSRFDQKWTFDVPTSELRAAFARKWIAKVTAGGVGRGVRFETGHAELAQKVAAKTEGFSFAFMKELFISFLLSLAHARSSAGKALLPEDTLFKQIENLAEQIAKAKEARLQKSKDDKKDDKAEDDANDCWVPPDPVERSGETGVQV